MSKPITEKDFLNYIVEQFNIKSGSQLTAMDIKHEISLLPNPYAFIEYAKANKKNDKYDFMNGLQTFNAMIENFKKELKASVCSDSKNKASELVNKCRRAILTLLDKAPKGFNLYDYSQKATYATFPKYFEKKEIEILDAIGGCKRWMNEYDENQLLKDIVCKINENRINHYCKNLLAKPVNVDRLVLEQLAN